MQWGFGQYKKCRAIYIEQKHSKINGCEIPLDSNPLKLGQSVPRENVYVCLTQRLSLVFLLCQNSQCSVYCFYTVHETPSRTPSDLCQLFSFYTAQSLQSPICVSAPKMNLSNQFIGGGTFFFSISTKN